MEGKITKFHHPHYCTNCGQPLPGAFVVDLDGNAVRYRNRVLKMTPKQAELLYVLWRAYPHAVVHERIHSQVWGDADPVNSNNLCSIYVGRLRKLLSAIGATIETVHSRGYRLIIEETDSVPIQANAS